MGFSIFFQTYRRNKPGAAENAAPRSRALLPLIIEKKNSRETEIAISHAVNYKKLFWPSSLPHKYRNFLRPVGYWRFTGAEDGIKPETEN